ncbi:MAG: flagellar biosynthetic protein FliR [Oscillospiraceae bacterium]|jgi:flagellar biosynthetic protein FliR|nr:flagellar biosynthetic protein FliR [Oscillospiraceae bacterium]
MTLNTDAALIWLVQFLLIFTRISAMFVLSPILGRNSIPTAAKLGVSLLTAFMLINFYPPAVTDYPYDTLLSLSGAVLLELLVGFVLGFGTILFFNIVNTAGHIIDVQIGFSMSEQFDPAVGSQVPVTGNLLNIMFIECFLFADGIPRLVGIVGSTFQAIPIGGARISPEIAMAALEAFVNCFIFAINIAMPVLAASLLCEIGLGIIVRTAPQMNIFVIGIPIKIIVGLVALAMAIPVFARLTGVLFDRMYETMDTLFTYMTP